MLAYIPSLLLYNGVCLAEYIIFHYTKEFVDVNNSFGQKFKSCPLSKAAC